MRIVEVEAEANAKVNEVFCESCSHLSDRFVVPVCGFLWCAIAFHVSKNWNFVCVSANALTADSDCCCSCYIVVVVVVVAALTTLFLYLTVLVGMCVRWNVHTLVCKPNIKCVRSVEKFHGIAHVFDGRFNVLNAIINIWWMTDCMCSKLNLWRIY